MVGGRRPTAAAPLSRRQLDRTARNDRLLAVPDEAGRARVQLASATAAAAGSGAPGGAGTSVTRRAGWIWPGRTARRRSPARPYSGLTTMNGSPATPPRRTRRGVLRAVAPMSPGLARCRACAGTQGGLRRSWGSPSAPCSRLHARRTSGRGTATRRAADSSATRVGGRRAEVPFSDHRVAPVCRTRANLWGDQSNSVGRGLRVLPNRPGGGESR